ncbi:MAG: hypothetical protein ACTSVV_16880 [Promethearchaeota archaeon]
MNIKISDDFYGFSLQKYGLSPENEIENIKKIFAEQGYSFKDESIIEDTFLFTKDLLLLVRKDWSKIEEYLKDYHSDFIGSGLPIDFALVRDILTLILQLLPVIKKFKDFIDKIRKKQNNKQNNKNIPKKEITIINNFLGIDEEEAEKIIDKFIENLKEKEDKNN